MKLNYLVEKIKKATFFVAYLLVASFATAQDPIETTVFKDDFEGESLTGGTPATTYVFLKHKISGEEPVDAFVTTEGLLCLSSPANSVGRNGVFGTLSVYNAPFAPKLSQMEADSIVWTFNMRTNRETTSGFNDNDFGVATVLLADAADYTSASGYAVVSYGSAASNRSFRLVKFADGLNATSKFTDLVNVFVAKPNVHTAFRIIYIKSTNTWVFNGRSDSGYTDPTQGTFTNTGSAVDDTFVNTTMTHFGFFINCKVYTTTTNLFVDNYKVRTYKTISGLNQQEARKMYNLQIYPDGVEIETVSARATLYDITGSVRNSVSITGKGKINIAEKGLYLLKIDLPDGKSAVEKFFVK